jgi:hypothetical protein
MDGLCRAVAAPLPIRIGGQLRLLSPLRLVDYGTIENYLLAQRPSPLMAVRKSLLGIPVEVVGSLVEAAVEEERRLPNYIDPDSMQRYLETRTGSALALWLMLSRHQPAKFDEADEYVHALPDDEFERLLVTQATINGLTEASERDWLRTTAVDDDEAQPAKRKRFNWKYAVRQLCEAYMGLTPSDVGELTMYTFRELYIEAANVRGRRVSREQWEREQKKLREVTKGPVHADFR